jgi:hypothetical protein
MNPQEYVWTVGSYPPTFSDYYIVIRDSDGIAPDYGEDISGPFSFEHE